MESDELEKSCELAKEKLNKHLLAVARIFVTTTPFVILGDGKTFYGINLQMIDEYLDETKALNEFRTEKKVIRVPNFLLE